MTTGCPHTDRFNRSCTISLDLGEVCVDGTVYVAGSNAGDPCWPCECECHGEAPRSPQEARTPSDDTRVLPSHSGASGRLQAALDARSDRLRASASTGATAAGSGCHPDCFVCRGEGGLEGAYQTDVTPT